MKDIFTEIWATARRNKLRTALTGFSVAWGIFMLIFLLGAGNGLINAQLQSSDRFLTNSMMVFGGWTSKPYDGLKEGRKISLNEKDMTSTGCLFADNVDNVGASLSQYGVTMSFGNQYVNPDLAGVYPNHFEINKRELLYGRFINNIDIRERRKVVVVNKDHAKELMPKGYARLVGRHVNINGTAYKVVGIYKPDKSMQDNETFTPFTTIKTIYGMGDEVGDIEFSFHGLVTEQQNKDFEDRYRTKLNTNHRAAPDDNSAVWLWNRYMLITVKERTREFGIRKAIGATPWSILRLIIVESVIITTIFGYAGMLCGIAANEYMDATIGHEKVDTGMFEATIFANPTVGLDVCIEATLVMIAAGTIAGLIPARKAARIRPIEALRAE